MSAITINLPDDSQINVIKAFLKALKIKFSIATNKEMESPYNPDFVAMVKKGQEDIKNGKGVKMTLDELKELCK